MNNAPTRSFRLFFIAPWLAALTLLCSCASWHVWSNQRQLRKGLVLYFPFDGNAQDKSGNGNHGIVSGATPNTRTGIRDVHGNPNPAYDFKGQDFIEVKSSPSLDITDALTLAAWVRHAPNPPGAIKGRIRPYEVIISKEMHAIPCDRGYRLAAWWLNPHGYSMGLYDTSRRIMELYDASLYHHICFVGEDPVVGKWTHIAAMWDGAMMRIYQNGQLRSSVPFTGKISLSGESLFVGMHPLKDQGKFRGSLDEIRIYNRALSEAEIGWLYDMPAWLK